ncbi:MAG: MBL fold metallo-hydrolase [Microcoleus sp. PH2017_10_PVI_O_A]|uniref:ComEC/Rec2 family competence protein n=1 Tax=unclassified Microcoleus TaxID=2642155 RepID=UPI001DA02FD3|nr:MULTISPECIES: MBL fold metallo-hydrolase [unclassified Microcoleus]TAE84042.1 MAG: MBL fold metallo-hydrolase [Oscillatoriales cyanobacterium]MCC3405640.1 MBL fold metallo-hydrolase [Microcoleus sp. PH2017_10_PVI_O_A]MCC3459593.1 MBL fold metallo-hydrolase [Microcoleus sp. PH2017_11_PCY_U_A]MCC3478105.1 MBL fold metallo-hydrolase [Microcoleus sp. PH2017_12_PCY_D_A]MCC3528095.1 MBL fold metallo-hydrolase [Microcoleus sp. PH2017_21_RUC_O_A]
MMSLPELIILDVGHGNCAILRDTNGVIIIDCPHGVTLIETLENLSIQEISHILISHADGDHIAGIINLLSNETIKINNVHLNPDLLRKTEIWKDLIIALKDARQRFGTVVSSELTTTKTGQLNVGQVTVEILAPTPELALLGGVGKTVDERRLNPNSTSAVIGLVHNTHRVAILCADIDQVGLDQLLKERSDLKADILVFPHHGGRPGGADGKAFAQQLCNLVKPNLVVFSIGRGRFSNPREEIVEGVVSSVPMAHILCTQLSSQCADSVPDLEPTHLNNLPARGRRSNSCCGGTVSIKIEGNRTTSAAGFAPHKEFIDRVYNPLCRRFLVRTES